MSFEELQKLIESLPPDVSKSFHLTILTGDNDPEPMIRKIRDLGYFCMLRLTAFGEELVVTGKVDHGNSGFTWDKTS